MLYFNRSVYKLRKAYQFKPFFYKFFSIAPYLGVCVYPNFAFSDLEEKTGKNRQDAYLDFGVGAFDVFRENRETAFSLEYQPAHVWHTIRPVAGAMITTHLATYLHLGFAFSWVIGDVFLLSPGFSAGWYQKGKSGKDLGFPLEFRSGVIVAWVHKQQRFGVHFYHLSNASLGRINPGAESLTLFFSQKI